MARLFFPAAFRAFGAAVLVSTAALFFSGCVTGPSVTMPGIVTPATSRVTDKAVVTRRPVTATVASQMTLMASNAEPNAAGSHSFAWQYPDDTNIVFNIYSKTNFLEPFHMRETVTEKVYRFTMDADAEFFEVTASNIVTGAESPPATR